MKDSSSLTSFVLIALAEANSGSKVQCTYSQGAGWGWGVEFGHERDGGSSENCKLAKNIAVNKKYLNLLNSTYLMEFSMYGRDIVLASHSSNLHTFSHSFIRFSIICSGAEPVNPSGNRCMTPSLNEIFAFQHVSLRF